MTSSGSNFLRGILLILLPMALHAPLAFSQVPLKPYVSSQPDKQEKEVDEDGKLKLSGDEEDDEKLKLTGEDSLEQEATTLKRLPKRGFHMEFLNYEEYAYSKSRKTEIGDQLELDMAVRYQFSNSTFGRFRFLTDPVENRFDNKTSRFEFLGGHVYENFYFQIDSELLTNDESTGGTSIGLDLDSEDTRITYNLGESFLFTFFPFNFDGEVGHEFNTWDVTRIYFIDGAPTTISTSPAGSEKIAEKTLGGFQLVWKANPRKNQGLVLGAGFGAATYQYPANSNFDIQQDPPSTTRWERKEDLGYKAFLLYRTNKFRFEGKYVGHNKAHETGSLLQSAGSLYSVADMNNFLVEAEATMSKAGDAPYRLSDSGEWFGEVSPWQPVYKDIGGTNQSWIGQTDWAYALKTGYRFGNVTPYLLYRYQGEHFIFRERESAHLLRTNDESESHGGLNRVGFGTYIQSGNFVVNPEFEYLMAQNAVFSNASDVRNDRQNASFVKEDFLVYLIVRYQFDGPKFFRP